MHLPRWIKRLCLLLAAGYIVSCLGLVAFERSLVYLPYPGPHTPQEAGLASYDRQTFAATDGAPIPYWEHKADAPILLYFHGNGGGLYAFTKPLAFLATQHFHVLAMGNRGYPSAPQHPSERALVRDAVALYDMAHQKYPKQKIILWGYSLGSGIATQLAATRHADALVLEAPFTATVDRAAQLFPWAPVHLLMRDQYPSREFIGRIDTPLFIMHGDGDRIIPISHGEALFARAAEPKTFRHYAGAGHLDLIRTPAYGDAVTFIHHAMPAAQ